MKKRNKIILPITVIAFSFALISINHALSAYVNFLSAEDKNIGISGIETKLGDADYYLFWDNDEPVALTPDTYTQNITSTGTYSYKITDAYSKTLYQSNEFTLDLTGDFSLSFDSESKQSSLTYSFSIEDDGKVFGNGMYCSPISSSQNAANCWIVGSFCNWSLGSFSRIQMYQNPFNTDDKGMAKHVYLAEGDSFKFVSDAWYGSQHLKAAGGFTDFATCFSCDTTSDNDITVNTTGYYDFALNSSNQLYVSKSTDDDYIQGTVSDTITTFTLDATKYASSSTYLSFYGLATNKLIEANSLTNLFSSKTNAACVLNKNIYLNPNVWDTDSAWFLAEVSGSSTRYELSKYDSTAYYKMSVPTSFNTINAFYRMSSTASHTDYLDSSVSIGNNDSGYWNKATSIDGDSIDIENYAAFKVTGWGESNLGVTSIPTGAPIYTLTSSN